MQSIHYVYKIMNLENGKFYIGKHSSDSIEDEYFGSGVGIRRAIAKYGIESFSKSIIAVFESSEEAFAFEAELVTKELVDTPLCYNGVLGGSGLPSGADHPHYGKPRSEEVKRRISEACRGRKRDAKARKNMAKVQFKPIVMTDKLGNEIKFDSITAAAKHIQPDNFISARTMISLFLNGKAKKARGYTFKYA
jgi:hypothetical protein